MINMNFIVPSIFFTHRKVSKLNHSKINLRILAALNSVSVASFPRAGNNGVAVDARADGLADKVRLVPPAVKVFRVQTTIV